MSAAAGPSGPADPVRPGLGLIAGAVLANASLGRERTAVTARLVAELFADGIGLAWLTAGGEEAERVHRRLGFRPLGALQRNHGH